MSLRSLMDLLRAGPGPDPRPVAQGLRVVRVGWGRYQYVGLPIPPEGQRWVRRPADELDLRIFEASGRPATAVEIASVRRSQTKAGVR